ncbi:MAG: NAD(P)-dependent oxidoreductase [Acidobacteriota bacterium]
MKVLITGGAGYIGSVLCEVLLDAGHRVTVLDDLAFGQLSMLSLAHRDGFAFVRGDARDPDTLRPLVREADVLIPLVALVGAPACTKQPRLAVELNTEAVRTLLALRASEQIVLFPNTNNGYGFQPDAVCTEDSPFAAHSLYGRTKEDAEKMVLESGAGVSFRLASAFGASPRMRFDLLLNDFVQRAVTDRVLVLFESGFQRNFVHVRDIAGAFLFALGAIDRMRGRVFNVGLAEANLTKRQLAERIKLQIPELTILESEIDQDPDKRDYVVSAARLEGLGWSAKIGLDAGIAELIRVCRMMPDSPLRNA